ncbi:MAG: NAD(P)H-quinone oxidoreductase subunit 2, chloroplastic [Alphaproteobacteria bacterium]|nr:MAG: NAD(P)H-quinone oxidoreductase subunit 2, chloroplastic [Alphaproteobacteria bacterium]
MYSLSIIGVLASVVGAYYYLRIVKIMYLDPPTDEVNEPMPRELSILAGVMTAFTLLFFIYPTPLVELADMASSVLVQSDLSLAVD